MTCDPLRCVPTDCRPRLTRCHLVRLDAIEEKAHCRIAGEEINRWVKRFRLEDWAITLVCGVPEGFFKNVEGVHGASQFDTTNRVATVWVNPKSNKRPKSIVIHELLHLIMAEVRDSNSGMIEERSVWLLAEIIDHESN